MLFAGSEDIGNNNNANNNEEKPPHSPSTTDFAGLVRNEEGLIKPVWFINSDGASDVGCKARKVLGTYETMFKKI